LSEENKRTEKEKVFVEDKNTKECLFVAAGAEIRAEVESTNEKEKKESKVRRWICKGH
jgi:predicted AAA+ superfamily ATPase